jgi:hypothetical protein
MSGNLGRALLLGKLPVWTTGLSIAKVEPMLADDPDFAYDESEGIIRFGQRDDADGAVIHLLRPNRTGLLIGFRWKRTEVRFFPTHHLIQKDELGVFKEIRLYSAPREK